MTPTKLLFGQILTVVAIVLLGLWFATQWAAYRLAYQPVLGAPDARLLGVPVYRPWALFGWWYQFDAYAPRIFDRAGEIAGASGIVACGAAVFGSLWRARQRKHVTTYGSARWAGYRDAEAAGLFDNAGVFLGRFRQRYLRHDGPEHVMAFAPTRSGKGVGLVVPTLLGWTGSAVVHDIKGENWQLTAGWRARFSHCLLFNPTDSRSARYNPLNEVRRGADEVRDVQNIADILVDPEGALERRSHWEKTSHSLLVGAILHILYAEEEKTLARVATFLSDPQRTFEDTLRRMMVTNHLGTAEPRAQPVRAVDGHDARAMGCTRGNRRCSGAWLTVAASVPPTTSMRSPTSSLSGCGTAGGIARSTRRGKRRAPIGTRPCVNSRGRQSRC
jgi:type IV secretion system protein VirD4